MGKQDYSDFTAINKSRGRNGISFRNTRRSFIWWGGLSAAVALARKKKRTGSFQKMNRIFGTVLSLFGILVFIRALPK